MGLVVGTKNLVCATPGMSTVPMLVGYADFSIDCMWMYGLLLYFCPLQIGWF